MEKTDKIYIAGHTGLVGSALVTILEEKGYKNLILKTRNDLDLTNQSAVEEFILHCKPDYVFLAAAKVGGILSNNTLPAEFIYQNILIQTNIIHSAYKANVKRLLFLGSSCIYPRNSPQPMKEEYLMTGELEATNRPYAIAKIAGIEMCWSYNRQYDTKYLAAMPTNLFGPNDNYDLKHSHVVPALIKKVQQAKTGNDDHVVVWGTGKPRREFLYINDLADACVFLMNLPDDIYHEFLDNPDIPPLINIGYGSDISIKQLAFLIGNILEYDGKYVFDDSYPDGTPQKLLDSSKIHSLGWRAKTTLEEGLKKTIANYQENINA